KLPTRVSIREVRRVKDELGGEESHVTAQFDKLFTDITQIFNVDETTEQEDMFNYVCVERDRGICVKEQAQIWHWEETGGLDYLQKHVVL
ncbi:MAG: hypothetical protein EZS28_053203, partial [Streblomastix strix]